MVTFRRRRPDPAASTPAPARRIATLLLVLALIATGLFVASRLAGPYIVSSNLIRGNIERAISRWSGHQVDIAGLPTLEFWPRPRIVLTQVTLTDTSGDRPEVRATIDRLSASFGLVQAVLGNPVFDNFEIVRPRLHLVRDRDGRIAWPDKGRLARAIGQVTDDGRGGQLLSDSTDARIGSIAIDDGRLEIRDTALDRTVVMDRIFADFAWPRMSAGLKGHANLLLAGVATRLDLASRQPLLLAKGAQAHLDAGLVAPAVTASFSGQTSLLPGRSTSGALRLSITDVGGLLAWTGAALPGTEALKTASLQASLSAQPEKLQLADLDLGLNGARATGIVDVTRARSGKPKLSGTLAFAQMDIPTFLGAFSLSTPDDREADGRSGLLDWLELDLSLSARSARLAAFNLTEMGGSILATNGTLAFDIADSTLAGGTLTAHLEGRNGGFDHGSRLDLAVTDADLASLESTLALDGPLPRAPGSFTLSASTAKALWDTRAADITGSIQLKAGPGTISQVNIDGIRALASRKPFFRLDEGGQGNLELDRLQVTGRLANGAIDITDGHLDNPSETITFAGSIPFDFKGLALSTALQPRVGGPPLQLFVGGAWPDLVLSPASPP